MAACQKQQPPQQRPPPEVLITAVLQRDVPVYREWIGNLDGWVNTQVRARVSGYLISQDYKEGAFVKAGQLLFRIDPRPLQAALAQAKGDLARAQASEKLAAMNLARANELFKGKVISAQERDTTIANYGTSKADVAAQEAAVQTAELNVEFATITAPVDGIAGVATAQIGDLVGPNSPQTGPLTTISTVDPIKAWFTITEQDYITFARRLAKGGASAAWQQAGQDLELLLADGSAYPHRGRFDFADRQVDVTTGSMRVAALFPNPGNVLRPGLFCRVRARVDLRKGALLVPERAVGEVQGSFQVMVVNAENRVAIRPVEPGERFHGWRVIRKGVQAGERVAVEGLQKARDGEAVAPREWTGGKPPAS